MRQVRRSFFAVCVKTGELLALEHRISTRAFGFALDRVRNGSFFTVSWWSTMIHTTVYIACPARYTRKEILCGVKKHGGKKKARVHYPTGNKLNRRLQIFAAPIKRPPSESGEASEPFFHGNRLTQILRFVRAACPAREEGGGGVAWIVGGLRIPRRRRRDRATNVPRQCGVTDREVEGGTRGARGFFRR